MTMIGKSLATVEEQITVLRAQQLALPDGRLREQVTRTLDRRLDEWAEMRRESRETPA